jgi:hypothetical protein
MLPSGPLRSFFHDKECPMSPHSTKQPMNSVRQRRKSPKALPEFLDRKLAVYALAAGAACVSVTAVAQEPGNSIGYTPANLDLAVWRDGTPDIHLDFNQDGVADATITGGASGYSLPSLSRSFYRAVENVRGSVIRRPLTKGMVVGPRGNFVGGETMLGTTFNHRNAHTYGRAHCWGAFADSASSPAVRYMGVRFSIGSETHYGWVRLTVYCSGGGTIGGTITGYAYEKVPNKGIAAGQTYSGATDDATESATLGALSLGVDGLDLWRK